MVGMTLVEMRRLAAMLLVASAAVSCSSSSGGSPPDYTTLSQLNAIWSLQGQLSFICNGSPVNENVSGTHLAVFDGAFDARVPLAVSTCGTDAIRFQGAIDLTGAITGNVSTTGASPLVDTMAGFCTSSSCKGNTSNTGLLSFTFSNTHENVYDGTTWQLAVTCSDGMAMNLRTTGASIANAGTLQDSGTTCPGPICTATGSMNGSASETITLTGMVANDGTLSASLAQGAAETLSFAGATNTSFTALAGTATSGAAISLKQCSTTMGTGLPLCVACISTQ